MTPLGPSFGWMAGQLLANALFPEELPDVHQQGPRLNDLSVQSSAYGNAINWMKGTARMAGNIIWAKPLSEVVTTTTTEQGGKGGGPSQTTTQTTYQYFATFCVAYCQGEAVGSARNWFNGELIIDDRVTLNAGSYVISHEKWTGKVRFYPGSETQLVDSDIEDYEGVGESSAYRGVCHMVYVDIDVTNNHMIPVMEAEIVKDGSIGAFIQQLDSDPSTNQTQFDGFPSAYASLMREVWVVDSHYNVVSGDRVGPARMAIRNIDTGTWSFAEFPDHVGYPDGEYWRPLATEGNGAKAYIDYIPEWNVIGAPCSRRDAFESNYAIWDCTTKALIGDYHSNSAWAAAHTTYGTVPLAFDPIRNKAYAWWGPGEMQEVWDLNAAHLPDALRWSEFQHDKWGFSGLAVCDKNGDFWSVHPAGHVGFLMGFFHIIRDGEGPLTSYSFEQVDGDSDEAVYGQMGLVYDAGRHCLYYWSKNIGGGPTGARGYLMKFDCTTKTSSRLSGLLTSAEAWSHRIVYSTLDDEVLALNGGTSGPFNLGRIKCTDGTFTSIDIPDTGGAHFYNPFAFAPGIIWSWGGFWEGGVGGGNGLGELRYNSVTSTAVTHAAVAQAIFQEVGVGISELDLTAITGQTLHGYVIGRVGTGRAALEPLQQLFYTDYVDSDGKITAVVRGGSPVLTIPEEDLGAVQFGTTPVSRLKAIRKQDLDQPREVRVTYPDVDSNYQVGTQYERILGGPFQEIKEITSSVVMTASAARQFAQRELYRAHVARFQIEFSTSIKYGWLRVTDQVYLVRGNVTYLVRLLQKRVQGNLVRWVGETEDPTIYTQNGAGALVAFSIAGVQGNQATTLYLLDIPLLREQEDYPGLYVAAAGPSGWRGGVLHASADGTTYVAATNLLPGASIGLTSSALGNWTGGNALDYSNELRVNMVGNGTLSTCTLQDMRNGVNHALVGNEIIAFKEASLEAPGQYLIRNFLRARCGTEIYLDTHSTGELFVLLTPQGLSDLTRTLSDKGVPRYYKPVSLGDDVASTQAQQHTYENVRQLCLSPVKLRANKNPSTGDMLIKWTRRTRYSPNWVDFGDVPIGETSLLFDVEIWNSTFTTLKRTYTDVADVQQMYSNADQVTDFGGTQSTVYTRIYQKNANGRGRVLQGSVI